MLFSCHLFLWISKRSHCDGTTMKVSIILPCLSASGVTRLPALSKRCLNRLCSTSSCCSPATSMASMLKSETREQGKWPMNTHRSRPVAGWGSIHPAKTQSLSARRIRTWQTARLRMVGAKWQGIRCTLQHPKGPFQIQGLVWCTNTVSNCHRKCYPERIYT